MRIRQGVEQDAVDNGEKRGVRPNPKRQGENGNSGEAGRLRSIRMAYSKSCDRIGMAAFYVIPDVDHYRQPARQQAAEHPF